MIINLDWDGCNYSPLNGFHPLFSFLQGNGRQESNTIVDFVVCSYSEKLFSYERFDPAFKAELSEVRIKNAENRAFEWTWRYFDSDEQFLTELISPCIFFSHTFPLSLGIRPFVFHVEDIKSMFLPFAAEFDIDVSAANQHSEFDTYRKYLGGILSSEKCLAIFCHYTETSHVLLQLFPEYQLCEKVRMLDLASLHREYRDSLKTRTTPPKNRLLFTHSYHGNTNSIRARGLDSFFDLCKKLAASDLSACLIPTLILPTDYNECIPDDIGLEVFHWHLPNDIYESILSETRFHFISSPWIHTKVIVDCIINNIVPIFRRHTAYNEYGFSDLNSINLCRPDYNALAFYKEIDLTLQLNFEDILSKMRVFINDASNNCVSTVPLCSKSNSEDSISSLLQLKQALASLGADCDSQKSFMGHLERISPKHFAMSPRFLVHARFNGLTIRTDRQRYLYTRLHGMPSGIGMSDLLNGHNFFKSKEGFVLFDDLTSLPAAIQWGVVGIWYPATLRQKLQIRLARHKNIYLFMKAIYRGVKKTRNKIRRLF